MADKKKKTSRSAGASSQKPSRKKTNSKKKTTGAKAPAKKNTSSKANTKSRSTSSKNASANKTASTSRNTRSNTRVTVEERGINMRDEGQLILSLCLAALMLLSNFGLCGSAGNMMSNIFFGLFGFVQYLMPIAFFIAISLLIINDYSTLALKKCFAAFIFLIMVAAFIQLVSKGTDISTSELFQQAMEDRLTGGVIGGGFACYISRWFGMAGSVLILLCIAILSLIMMVQKSFVGFFKDCITRFHEYAQRLKEQAQEEKEQPVQKETRRRKTFKDREREKKCEEKVKEIEERKKNAQNLKPPAKKQEAGKTPEFNIPTFSSSENVKRKDAVKELHPEIYPFTQNDGKTNQFDGSLDFTAFSFNSGMSPEEFAQDMAASMPSGMKEIDHRPEEADFGFADDFAEEDALSNGMEIPVLDLPDDIPAFSRTPREEEEKKAAREEWIVEGEVLSEETIPEPAEEETKENVLPKVSPAEKKDNEFEKKMEKANAMAMGDVVIHKEEKKAVNKNEEKASETPKPFQVKKAEKQDYVYPPLSLLKKGENQLDVNYDDQLKSTAKKLQDTLHSFGVNVKMTAISFGPTVTRYEMVPEQGTKVSKIVSLTDDIKLNLAAEDIRIEAPIPGKSAIGIEVPNKDVMMVYFRELIDTPRFRNDKSKVAFAVGKDIGGQTVITDIAKMPHLLIAGATGSGKSVCINTLIMSILYKARPDEVKLIMIDPKMVELSIYNGIPHLLIPVVTDPKKASGALNWAVAEMTERYNKFTTFGVRNIEGYNQKVKQVLATGEVDASKLQKMPQIVVIIDELADLMMVAPGEVEDAIVRLSQLARAAGIHLVIATQRPSVNVITGLIKANVPSRIAFAVTSGVDSRTIIDMNGAEKLLGKGDMLFHPAGSSKPSRVQGAYISDDEITAVVDFLKENQNMAVMEEAVDLSEKIEQKMVSQESTQERDEYFADAARFILEKDKASIGMLQRMFKIGFNRAARIMDQLADAGVVGPEEGTKPRRILMSQEQLDQYLEEYY